MTEPGDIISLQKKLEECQAAFESSRRDYEELRRIDEAKSKLIQDKDTEIQTLKSEVENFRVLFAKLEKDGSIGNGSESDECLFEELSSSIPEDISELGEGRRTSPVHLDGAISPVVEEPSEDEISSKEFPSNDTKKKLENLLKVNHQLQFVAELLKIKMIKMEEDHKRQVNDLMIKLTGKSEEKMEETN